MTDNPPPSRYKPPHQRQVSFTLYVNGCEIGHAYTTEHGHTAVLFVGADEGDTLHIRAESYEFHVSAAVPYLTAYMDGDRIGQAKPPPPLPDGKLDHKGYELRLPVDAPDGSEILLFIPHLTVVSGGRKPRAKAPALNHS